MCLGLAALTWFYFPMLMSIVLACITFLSALTLWAMRERLRTAVLGIACSALAVGSALDGFVMQFVGAPLALAGLLALLVLSGPNTLSSVVVTLLGAVLLEFGLGRFVLCLYPAVVDWFLERPVDTSVDPALYGWSAAAMLGTPLLWYWASRLKGVAQGAETSRPPNVAACAFIVFPLTGAAYVLLAWAGAPLTA